jgi:hypothetical protein
VKTKETKMSLSQRVLGAVDLAIEFATLGEYGLEEVDAPTRDVTAEHTRRERPGHRAGWNVLARPRRGGETPVSGANCLAAAHTARR